VRLVDVDRSSLAETAPAARDIAELSKSWANVFTRFVVELLHLSGDGFEEHVAWTGGTLIDGDHDRSYLAYFDFCGLNLSDLWLLEEPELMSSISPWLKGVRRKCDREGNVRRVLGRLSLHIARGRCASQPRVGQDLSFDNDVVALSAESASGHLLVFDEA